MKAELTNGLAHQIRVLRKSRGWTQLELAKKLTTTQAAISRIEDPSYGKFSVKTLLDIGAVFDIGLLVKFVPFSRLIQENHDTSEENFKVLCYDAESKIDDIYGVGTGHVRIDEQKVFLEAERSSSYFAGSRIFARLADGFGKTIVVDAVVPKQDVEA